MTKPLEVRWIVLTTDGRHVTLGRHTDPSEDEINVTEGAMAIQGVTGFLAIMRGGYYIRSPVELMQVRPLAGADPEQWAAAAAAFLVKRTAALAA
jgi:hypothetical protein